MKKFLVRCEFLSFINKCKKENLRIVPIRCGNKTMALIGLE